MRRTKNIYANVTVKWCAQILGIKLKIHVRVEFQSFLFHYTKNQNKLTRIIGLRLLIFNLYLIVLSFNEQTVQGISHLGSKIKIV